MSLVSTLMGGVTESALNLSEFDYSSEASMESYWLDAACEALVSDIYNVDRAYLTADVIGEVKTITEGADPQVLLEGMISTGIEKIKEAFRKFLAKIKEWAAKVKRFFKIIFLKGKDFVKEFGKEIRAKSVKGFKYKGYIYDIEGGDNAVDEIKDKVSKEINRLLSATNDDARADYTSGNAGDQLSALNSITDNENASDWQDKLCKNASTEAQLGSVSDLSELMENLTEKYHGGDSDKQEVEDFEGKGNDPSDMLSFIESSDKSIKEVEKEEKAFEKEINGIIKHLDKLAATSKKDRADIKSGGNTVADTAYKAASKVSGYLSSALTVQKSTVDKKVSIYKEAAGAFTTILKSFLRFKPAKEGYDFGDADEIIALTEAGDAVEPDVAAEEEPAGADDKGKEKDAATEGAALFESAYRFL